MARALTPIPVGAPITDRAGTITIFFRLAWQLLVDSFATSPTIASLQRRGLTDALPTTRLYTTPAAGHYRITVYLRKTVADGATSALAVTATWTQDGVPLSLPGPALTVDAVTAVQSVSAQVYADGQTDLAIAVAYASTTPNRMTYSLDATVESLSA